MKRNLILNILALPERPQTHPRSFPRDLTWSEFRYTNSRALAQQTGRHCSLCLFSRKVCCHLANTGCCWHTMWVFWQFSCFWDFSDGTDVCTLLPAAPAPDSKDWIPVYHVTLKCSQTSTGFHEGRVSFPCIWKLGYSRKGTEHLWAAMNSDLTRDCFIIAGKRGAHSNCYWTKHPACYDRQWF